MSEDRGREQVNRRVAFALICLALLCPVLIFVNLCTGSTGITAADVMAILAGNAKDATAASIILQIRFPRAVAAMILGGVFPQSDRRSVCAGDLFRSQAVCRGPADLLCDALRCAQQLFPDQRRVCRCAAVHGLCTALLNPDPSDLDADRRRYHDRLHLFRGDGFYRDLCR